MWNKNIAQMALMTFDIAGSQSEQKIEKSLWNYSSLEEIRPSIMHELTKNGWKW